MEMSWGAEWMNVEDVGGSQLVLENDKRTVSSIM